MKRLKENKGITLIALIITIIVMLILVAVTVNVAINGGLFKEANNAATDTEREAIYDQIVSAMALKDKGILNVSETAKAAIEDLKSKGYTVSPEANEIANDVAQVTLTVTGKKGTYEYTITEEEITKEGNGTEGNNPGGEIADSEGTVAGNRLIDLYGSTLNVGDYVEYTPSTSSPYSPDGTVAGSLTGYSDSLQSVAQDTTLKWRVLGSDGTHVLLISATPTTSSGSSMNFYGYVGYNNYEDVLEDTCEALYSNKTIGATARSITMEDIDTYLGGSAYSKSSFGAGESSGYYGFTNIISSKFKPQADGTLSKLDSAENISLTQDVYYYNASDVINDSTKLELLIGSNLNPYNFWTSGRAVYVPDEGGAIWSFCTVKYGYFGFADSDAATSRESEYGFGLCLRPVVVLDSSVTDIQVTITGNSTPNTWNDPLGLNEDN